ncbi:four helix bundle protein [Patescibacteria group bacterium]|nr:four helix bundle protein [Patescibacteria group bacterium]
MKDFTDLEAWQKGMNLLKEVYKITGSFPKEEKYNLTSQMRRASTSVLTNTAEGFGRSTSPDKAYRYTIARGECTEVHALLIISVELGIITMEDAKSAIELTSDTGKLLSGLIRKYSSSKPQPQP